MFPILKILTPKVLKGIMSYVFEENELDQQLGSVRARLDELEKMAHPIRKFVQCEACKCKIKENSNG